jgi:transposase
MKIIKQNLALDVDSKELKVCFKVMREDLSIKTKGSRTFKNTLNGFQALKAWTEKKRVEDLPVHVTMEATGVYYENVAYYFNDQRTYLPHVVLGNTSNAYFKSLNRKSKTDKIDADGLAQMGLERQLPNWKPVSAQMQSLKKLVRERLRLQKEKTMVLNQLHAEQASYCPYPVITQRYKKRIIFLEKQIQEVEKNLKSTVDLDDELQQRIKQVCTAKSIGFITAIGIVAEYNGFILFKNRNQVVSYAGYDIAQNESGTSIKGKTKISKKGNSYVRQMMYMSAMSAAVHDDHHKNYYTRIVAKTGIKMKANVAIQRKLLLLIYTLFTNNIPYDPLHFLKVQKRLKQNKEGNLSNEKMKVEA